MQKSALALLRPLTRVAARTSFRPAAAALSTSTAIHRPTASAQEPSPDKSERVCFACGQPGHAAHQCPNADNGYATAKAVDTDLDEFDDDDEFEVDDRKGRDVAKVHCLRCGQRGHYADDCPSSEIVCFNCSGTGHRSNECPNPRKTRDMSDVKCYNCDKDGHISRDCPEPRRERDRVDNRTCFRCGESASFSFFLPLLPFLPLSPSLFHSLATVFFCVVLTRSRGPPSGTMPDEPRL
ncbi:hypothetical protein EXIGLDRAFT_203955 [Exidia glandulosa HHB12029]|uniref:CCHC-type domain-containing protein n=1 Tax=Exidia glandulosa HHB12029 TaxID=1314781 RepID=A0A165ENI1_EXIGL|nr:hypothetical protein EXIGLDRAFT_203955 [Exidia glandulosa HHB12029]